MNQLPQKVSLVAQTVAVLAQQIEGGRWADCLPGESALCAQLHVGRKTIRAALAQLQRQGWLSCRRGARRRILRKTRPKALREGNRVVLLMPAELHTMNSFIVFLIDKLRQYLAEEGCKLETQVSRAVYRSRAPAILEELSRALHPAGWVLCYTTEAMQRWFAARHLPCVVMGSSHPGIKVSSVDVDYEALCMHAVHQFIARGHQRLALLNPQAHAAGDAHTKSGFLDAVGACASAGVTAQVLEHDGTPAGICQQVRQGRAAPAAPSAFLVSRASHFLTVLTFLLGTGVQIPREVALISRESDLLLESVVPEVTRYSQDQNLFAAHTCRMVMRMIGGDARIEQCKVMPSFIKGKTLA